ncbi:MAG: DUF1150 family protein [Limibacillus sp.]|jgi:hypothetical protein
MFEETARQTPLSPQDFETLGMDRIAYAKPVEVDGQPMVAIHSADGNQLALVASEEAAWAAIRQNDLEPVRLN